MRTILGVASITIAFTLYGLTMGVSEGFYRAAADRNIQMSSGPLMGAAVISAIGFALILFLTANAMAHSVRLRIGEFGVLKAIGFSHRLILAIVTAEAVLPCLFGAALGLGVAKLLFFGLVSAIPLLARFPAPIYTPALLEIAGGLAIFIGAVSAAVPATRIIRLDAAAAISGGLRVTSGPTPLANESRASIAASPSALHLSGPLRFEINRHLTRQILSVTRTGFSTLPLRFKDGLVIVVGVGAMVFVLLSFLSMVEGIRILMLGSGDPARAVIHRLDKTWAHGRGEIPDNLQEILATAPGVARSANGAPMVDAGVTQWTNTLVKRNNGENGNTSIRGVGPLWREMSPSVRIVEGRMPRSGARELLAGDLARRKFSDLDDNIVELKGMPWRIVGTFSGNGWQDGWLLGDAKTLKAVAKQTADNVVLVRLTSPQAFDAFRQAVNGKLPPDIVVEREPDHYAQSWRSLSDNVPALYIGYFLAGVVGIGMVAGTMHTMHGALEARAREIAILRAIGFDGIAVAVSVVLEAMFLAVLGACIGTAGGWLWLDSFLYNGAGGVFAVTVNWRLLLVGSCWGLTVALMGTLSLAIRAARQTPIDALREA